jgi:hypothetical protein
MSAGPEENVARTRIGILISALVEILPTIVNLSASNCGGSTGGNAMCIGGL